MAESLFLSAVQQATEGRLSLGDVINTTTQLTAAGQTGLSIQLYKIWESFNREHPQIYVAQFNRSVLHSQVGDGAGAIEALRAAITVNPGFMPAYINLGGQLERAGAAEEGLELWRDAVRRLGDVNGLNVGYKSALLKQIARVMGEAQRVEGAEAALRDSLALDPHQDDVLEQYVAQRLAQCKWPIIVPWDRVDRRTLMGGFHPLSMAAFTDDPLLQLGLASQYIARMSEKAPNGLESDRRHAPIDLEGRRLRVGYVSSDLRDHAVGYLMAELFEVHDRSKVEVFAYYCGRPSDHEALTIRTKAAVEHWVDIRELSDDEAARRIAADRIDILVDVNGHTRDARTGVFARRPAPVQVNWLGYPGSMGSPYHHYIVGDDWIIPPEFELYYSEKVLRLPCYQPNDRKRVAAARPTRAQAGLPENAFVFCCFNGTQKITRFTFERWMEILRRTPHSVLWLLEGASDTYQRLCQVAETFGVSRDRLIVAPKRPNPDHLARYPLADLFLDTTPYGAHTTASDALWMGVPVLTLSGRCFASRVCGSLTRAAGLPELVCERAEDYVERAVALANDPAAIAEYKARLEANRGSCDLFDVDKLTTRLEGLYFEMAEAHARGATPQPSLDNLDSYFAVGLTQDHDAVEVLALEDYHGWYRSGLEARHLSRPLRPDGRLWTQADLAAAERPAAGLDADRRRRSA